MLNGRSRLLLWLSLIALVVGVAAWVMLPGALAQLPGRVRQYLPEGLAEATVAPLPTAALPAGAADEVALLLATVALPPTVDPPPTPRVTAAPATPIATERAALPLPTATMAAPATEATLTPSPIPPADYPAAIYLEGVPIFPQKFNNCGPTNLSMVLAYHGIEVHQLDIAAVIRPTYEDRNVSPSELADYVTAQTGLSAAVVVGADLTLLKRLLAAGLPVIVEQGLVPSADVGWMGHYLTLFGYDEREQIFYTRDSFLGPWEEDGRESYETVLADWRPFNHVAVVIFPPEQELVVAGILGQTWRDPVSTWAAAAEQARAAIQADATDAFAWFNLGSALTRLHQFGGDGELLAQAVAAFDQARLLELPPRMLWYQFTPYEAYLAAGRTADVLALAEATLSSQGGRNVEETYIFRALARQSQGDEVGAAADLRRAAQLNPGNPLLRLAITPP